MIEIRIVKAIMVGCLAIFASLVTFDDLADYNSNFEFVRHVLSMDTIFPDSALTYRRVTSPALWEAAYAVIILGEGLTAAALAGATVVLLRHLRSPDRFNQGKRLVGFGVGMGFLMWFFGFMVIGGEWFAMWQSTLERSAACLPLLHLSAGRAHLRQSARHRGRRRRFTIREESDCCRRAAMRLSYKWGKSNSIRPKP